MSNETLNQFVQNHSLAKQMRQYKANIVWEKFSNWLRSAPSNSSWHNSLYKFAIEFPFCYINSQAIDNTLAILNTDAQNTLDSLKQQSEYVSRGIFSLLRPSPSWQIQDGERISIDTPRGIEAFENIWHPEYIKYCEQVYNHLIKIPLSILEKQNKKDYLSLALSLRAEKLSKLGYPSLISGFDSVVRNAISHGGIEYDIADIHFLDVKDKREIYAPDLVRLLDDLFDTCNSIIIALIIFIIDNQSFIEKTGVENLPLGIKFLLVDGYASHNGSKLISFIESGKNKQQLNINIKTNTPARGVHQLESLQVAWAACYFGGKSFDRYLVSIDCNMPVQPLAIIDGKVLRGAIEKEEVFTEIAPALFESSLLWYDTSQLSFRMSILQSSFKTNWEIQKRNFSQEMTKKGNFIPRLHYKIVFSKNTSPKSFRRLEGHAVLDISNKITETDLLRIIKSAVNQLRRQLIRRKDINGEFGLPGSPFSINLRLYSVDKRIRRLMSYTWQDEELVAIVEFSKNWEKSPPFYTKQPDRVIKQIRIKYNSKLIKIEET